MLTEHEEKLRMSFDIEETKVFDILEKWGLTPFLSNSDLRDMIEEILSTLK
jgi:hypothetical protein